MKQNLFLVVSLLGVLVVGPALGVVHSNYESRRLVHELHVARSETATLEVRREQLRLDLATWANRARIEAVSRGELGMVPVSNDSQRTISAGSRN